MHKKKRTNDKFSHYFKRFSIQFRTEKMTKENDSVFVLFLFAANELLQRQI